MIQQINLYQDARSDQHLLQNAYTQGVLAFVGLLLLVGLWSGYSWYDTQAKLTDLRSQLEGAQAQLLQEQALNVPTENVQLEQELKQTQSLYQSLALTLERLADTQSDVSTGFSKYLLALAQQADGQVWITNIHVESEANSIRLRGQTERPDQIPLFLERLQPVPAFKGHRFARLTVQQSEALPDQVEFTVSSSLQPDQEGADEHSH